MARIYTEKVHPYLHRRQRSGSRRPRTARGRKGVNCPQPATTGSRRLQPNASGVCTLEQAPPAGAKRAREEKRVREAAQKHGGCAAAAGARDEVGTVASPHQAGDRFGKPGEKQLVKWRQRKKETVCLFKCLWVVWFFILGWGGGLVLFGFFIIPGNCSEAGINLQ